MVVSWGYRKSPGNIRLSSHFDPISFSCTAEISRICTMRSDDKSLTDNSGTGRLLSATNQFYQMLQTMTCERHEHSLTDIHRMLRHRQYCFGSQWRSWDCGRGSSSAGLPLTVPGAPSIYYCFRLSLQLRRTIM